MNVSTEELCPTCNDSLARLPKTTLRIRGLKIYTNTHPLLKQWGLKEVVDAAVKSPDLGAYFDYLKKLTGAPVTSDQLVPPFLRRIDGCSRFVLPNLPLWLAFREPFPHEFGNNDSRPRIELWGKSLRGEDLEFLRKAATVGILSIKGTLPPHL